MTYLGLDLGTALAKLARCPGGEPREPGGTPEVRMVQSAVSYRDGSAGILDSYRDEPPGAIRCDGFVSMLGTALADGAVAAWQDRTPAEVARDFLRCLVGSAGARHARVRTDLETRLHLDDPGPEPPGIVIAVPPCPAAPHDAGEQRADVGTGIESALRALGWPPIRLVATPVAALLWFRHQDPRLAAARRLLVIDAGAGSVEFSLCTASGTALRVVDWAQVSAEATWASTDRVGDTRPQTLTEHLVTALAAAARGGLASGEPGRLGRVFEAMLTEDDVQDRLDAVLHQATALRRRHGGAVAVRFDGLDVTASQFLDATEPLVHRSVAALGELLGRQRDSGWRRCGGGDDMKVVFLGGLSWLWPLRAALLSSLGFDQERPGSGALIPASGDRMAAVACGAALLAAGLADPGDRYSPGLRVLVHQVIRDRLVPQHLTLAAPGSIDLERVHTEYLTEAGPGETRRVVVTVPPPERPAGDAGVEAAPIPVEVVPRDAAPVAVCFQPAAPPAPGAYWIGVRGGPDGPAVMLSPVDGGTPLTYPLAQPAGHCPDQLSAGQPEAAR